ncbi:MAG: DUF523 domain-containing protein [Bacilli bacterium]
MQNNKEKILISACLLGQKVRYDGESKPVRGIMELAKFYDLIPMCPELSGGLKIPRAPSEIIGDKVMSKNGRDVTDNYNAGAYWASSICRLYNVKLAVLKQRSPSCGSKVIHDGSFTDKVIPGKGITVRKLEKMGVKVIDEDEALALIEELKSKGE